MARSNSHEPQVIDQEILLAEETIWGLELSVGELVRQHGHQRLLSVELIKGRSKRRPIKIDYAERSGSK